MTSIVSSAMVPPVSTPVVEPGKHDILCGRGGNANGHYGNVQMRCLLSEMKHQYFNEGKEKYGKLLILDEIVHRIRRTGGRFLKQDPKTKLWHDIGDEKARKKVSQALREVKRSGKGPERHPDTKRSPTTSASPRQDQTHLKVQPTAAIIDTYGSSTVQQGRKNSLAPAVSASSNTMQQGPPLAHSGPSLFLEHRMSNTVQTPTRSLAASGSISFPLPSLYLAAATRLLNGPLNKHQGVLAPHGLFAEGDAVHQSVCNQQTNQVGSRCTDALLSHSVNSSANNHALAQQHILGGRNEIPTTSKRSGPAPSVMKANSDDQSTGEEPLCAVRQQISHENVKQTPSSESFTVRGTCSPREQNSINGKTEIWPQPQNKTPGTSLANSTSRLATLMTASPEGPAQIMEQPNNTAAADHSVVTVNDNDDSQDCSEPSSTDELAAAFLLSTFSDQLDNAPMFTAEQEGREKEDLTEEDRLEIVSDLFGDLCEITRPKKKVARKSVRLHSQPDQNSQGIHVLLRQMRATILHTPIEEKTALMEALSRCSRPEVRCSTSEFCDERMKLFLQRENMDPEKAAQRFIKYWTKRRELFGRDKFHLPMTLGGALDSDDRVALETGTLSILACPDVSGRPILLGEPPRNTKDGYTTESFLRAAWCWLEHAAQMPNAEKGVVLLIFASNITLWEYDRKIDEEALKMARYYLPFNFCSIHVTGLCAPLFKLLVPITRAFMDKRERCRFVAHTLTGNALVDELECYGMTRDILPDYMGGTYPHNRCEWFESKGC